MNKKGQIDFDGDPVKAIFGIIILLIFGFVVIAVLTSMTSIFNEQQCKPLQDQINLKDTQIAGLTAQLNETNNQLGICRSDYETLLKENITKQDFEEIKNYYNLTQIQINSLSQQFQSFIDNNIKIENNVYNRYNISLTFNIVFALEILSFLLLKNEFALFMYNLIFKRKKEQNETTNKTR